MLVNLTLNFLRRSLLVTHFNTYFLLKPAYPSRALWWIFLCLTDLHFLNVFSTTLLASTCFRTCEMVKKNLFSIYFLHFLTYVQSVRKKDFFRSYTKKVAETLQKFFDIPNNMSIKLSRRYFVHSYNNTLQSKIQIMWHYRQSKEKEILDEKSLSIPFKSFVTDHVTFFQNFWLGFL